MHAQRQARGGGSAAHRVVSTRKLSISRSADSGMQQPEQSQNRKVNGCHLRGTDAGIQRCIRRQLLYMNCMLGLSVKNCTSPFVVHVYKFARKLPVCIRMYMATDRLTRVNRPADAGHCRADDRQTDDTQTWRQIRNYRAANMIKKLVKAAAAANQMVAALDSHSALSNVYTPMLLLLLLQMSHI
jgi:hypothetical protein